VVVAVVLIRPLVVKVVDLVVHMQVVGLDPSLPAPPAH
jgi:hypothetical protein